VEGKDNKEILEWFNELLVHYGQARWTVKGKKWRSVEERLKLSNMKWKKQEVFDNKSLTLLPSLSASLSVKRKLFEN